MNTLPALALAALFFSASARADHSIVCDAAVTDSMQPVAAEIALLLTHEASGHPSWTLMRAGRKFKGRKWLSALTDGYRVKVQDKDGSATMTYVFDETQKTVDVTWSAQGASKLLESRPCVLQEER